MFPGLTLLSGPKHSNSIPSIVELAVPLNDDVNEVASFVPNPVPDLAVKSFSGPQTEEEEVDRCERGHSLLPFTLQVVIPLTSPTTVHVKEKIPPEHVGGAAVNCPVTNPEGNTVKSLRCMHPNKAKQTHIKMFSVLN